MDETADIVICGAGIAGISAAYHLAVKQGVKNVVLVDEREPLTLTSDKSTECYRNWWPGPGDTMVRFMNHSIDLLGDLADSSGNYFNLNQRGYIFLTADPVHARSMQRTAAEIAALGAGELRVVNKAGDYVPSPGEGYGLALDGADLLLSPEMIQAHYPFINDEAQALLHARRCGWLSAQQMGMYMLEQAKAHGARLVTGRVTAVSLENNRIQAVEVEQNGTKTQIAASAYVIAAGPLVKQAAAMIGVDLPVFNELHGKIAFEDTQGVIPRHVPLMIWNDPVRLAWTDEERAELAAFDDTRWLVEEFPAGVHFRPEGGPGAQTVLAIWTYDVEVKEPTWPIDLPDEYAEIIMRGLVRMVPGLDVYLGKMARPYIDGGYYCKTQENRPIIGPLPVDGAYIIGALSGYGIMAAMAAGELLAAHVTGDALPDYASDFLLGRYDDPAYRAMLADWDPTTGQL
ncbi:MAG: FAD-binding oxidoreductase [Ardenticatenaceae bacterium]|nr:FAD-binding oxidoreductase [Ardenticatenaceae bacterium]